MARELTAVSPAALLLFGGALSVDHAGGTVSVLGGAFKTRAPAQTAVLFKRLRDLLDGELRRRIERREGGADAAGGARVVEAIAAVLEDDERLEL